MLAEQTSSCRYWLSEMHHACEIHLTINLSIPGEDVHLTTYLAFDPQLPEHVQETWHESLYEGVHGGIAATGAPLPEGGIMVKIVQVRLLPLPDASVAVEEVQRHGNILQALTREMVAALWTGLIQLNAANQSGVAP